MLISEQIWPRPVCLICSINEKGKPNVMTASFVMPISFKPKYVAFSVAPERLTFQNIQATKEFSINVCSSEQLKTAKLCGSYSGREIDKFERANLTARSSKIIKPPVIEECPISFECKVELMQKFGDHWLVVGKVMNEFVRKKQFKTLLHKSGDVFPRIE